MRESMWDKEFLGQHFSVHRWIWNAWFFHESNSISVIITNLDFKRLPFNPNENDPRLIIDANGMVLSELFFKPL